MIKFIVDSYFAVIAHFLNFIMLSGVFIIVFHIDLDFLKSLGYNVFVVEFLR